MNMDQEKFDAMIKRLEELAKRRPNAYKLRVFLLALLGYGYIFSIAAILLALLAFLVWGTLLSEFHINFGVLKIAGALLILTGIILRALWVRVSPPIGLRLDRTEAEQLYEEVDHLRKALKAPDIHEILLSDEFNALIAQIPRLGVLGGVVQEVQDRLGQTGRVADEVHGRVGALDDQAVAGRLDLRPGRLHGGVEDGLQLDLLGLQPDLAPREAGEKR